MGKFLSVSAGSRMEMRLLGSPDLRVVPIERYFHQGGEKLAGYAAKFGVFSFPLARGKFVEKIHPRAFDETLSKRDDVRFLFNHDPSRILARSASETLRLWTDSTGLAFEVDPPDTQLARDLATLIGRGDVSQCSFAFETLEDEWNDGSEGQMIRTLKRVRLADVSAVTYPAYPDTQVGLRSMVAYLEKDLNRLRRLRLLELVDSMG